MYSKFLYLQVYTFFQNLQIENKIYFFVYSYPILPINYITFSQIYKWLFIIFTFPMST
ncbi:MAG: hypothetical protein K2M17_06365 [Bacilli bacterium]|nr:hypothetical protein [Bacilli bacterium]